MLDTNKYKTIHMEIDGVPNTFRLGKWNAVSTLWLTSVMSESFETNLSDLSADDVRAKLFRLLPVQYVKNVVYTALNYTEIGDGEGHYMRVMYGKSFNIDELVYQARHIKKLVIESIVWTLQDFLKLE